MSLQALGQDKQQQQKRPQLYYSIYDSRSATYEKLDRLDDALRDVECAMVLVPARWQAYARAARLLLKRQQFARAAKMVQRAYARLEAELANESQTSEGDRDALVRHRQRCAELESIKASALRGLNGGKDIVLRSHKSSSCYILLLPTELLTEIFALVAGQDHTALAQTIIKVCKRWRQVALDCPALWDTLILGMSQRDPKKRARTWLLRSEGKISDLRVYQQAVVHDDWRRNLEKELMSLKWGSLRALTIEMWDIVQYLKAISSYEILHTLEKLTIEDDPFKMTQRWDTLLSATRQVTEMRLEGVRLSPQTIASRTLRQLSLEHCDFGDHHAFEFFELQPFLEVLAISLPATYSFRPWSCTNTINLNYLTHIDISGCHSVSFVNLVVPNLRVLRLFRCSSLSEGDFRHLAKMNLSNFEELSLIQLITPIPTSIVDFLKTVPTLRHLVLMGVRGFVVQVVEALAEPPHSSNSTQADLPCPRLEYLNVSDTPDIKSATLVRLVKSRLVDVQEDLSVTRIQSLIIDRCPRIEPDILPWFRQHVPVVSCIYLSKKAAWMR